MSHEHCDRCYSIECRSNSNCPIVRCPENCLASMHSCKIDDHRTICPKFVVSCSNSIYGCRLKIERNLLNEHLVDCCASVVVCPFTHGFQNNVFGDENSSTLPSILARRDNLWANHSSNVEKRQHEIFEKYSSIGKQETNNERLIRSEKYSYITIPECVLSKNDGIICITCRLHLRQLEENEEQRLAELNEIRSNNEQISSSDENSSLVQMTLTKIDPKEISSVDSTNEPEKTNTETTEQLVEPVRSDVDFPFSFLYRMKFFSTDRSKEKLESHNDSPRFFCAAFCRRNEIEQHHKIHQFVDRELNTTLFGRCPKSQYGCPFEIEKCQARLRHGPEIRVRFDHFNDAVAFQYLTTIENGDDSPKFSLNHFPDEILLEILSNLDSLSLRNVSLVSRRLRNLCETLLTSHGIVVNEYECCQLSHGQRTWIEKRKHWLFTNTCSSIDFWRMIELNPSTSISQHLSNCPFGPTIDLQSQKPFRLGPMAPPITESYFNKREVKTRSTMTSSFL